MVKPDFADALKMIDEMIRRGIAVAVMRPQCFSQVGDNTKFLRLGISLVFFIRSIREDWRQVLSSLYYGLVLLDLLRARVEIYYRLFQYQLCCFGIPLLTLFELGIVCQQ